MVSGAELVVKSDALLGIDLQINERVIAWPPAACRLQRLVRRSGQLRRHVPHQIGTKVHENCAADATAKIRHPAGDPNQGVEGKDPDPGEGRDVVEPAEEEHGSGCVQSSEQQRADHDGDHGAATGHGQDAQQGAQ